MRTLIVGYDLNKSGQNYEAVWNYLKGQSNWWHHLDSTWIIKTDLTVVQIRDGIAAAGLDNNDELFVGELTGAAAWRGFSQKGSDWLTNNL